MKRLILAFSGLSVAAALASCIFDASTAWAQTQTPPAKVNCAPPELINSVPMERVNGGNVMSVTATIDGSPERLLIDIGRWETQLWEAQADKLHLSHQQGYLFDFAGRYSERSGRVEQFTLGSMETGGFYIAVAPESQHSQRPI